MYCMLLYTANALINTPASFSGFISRSNKICIVFYIFVSSLFWYMLFFYFMYLALKVPFQGEFFSSLTAMNGFHSWFIVHFCNCCNWLQLSHGTGPLWLVMYHVITVTKNRDHINKQCYHDTIHDCHWLVIKWLLWLFTAITHFMGQL